MTKNKQLRAFILIILAIIASVFLFRFIINLNFRLVKSTPPRSGAISTSLKVFVLEFNRELDPNIDYLKTVLDPQKMVTEIKLEAKKLTVYTKATDANKKYYFELKNITAKDGSVIPILKFDYLAKYIPFNKIPKSQQALVSIQNSKLSEDNPILRHLPYGSLHFSLQAFFEEPEEEDGEFGDLVLVARLLLSNSDVRIDREGAVAAYKQEVLDYLTSIGLNPADYTIEYEVVEPTL